MAQERKVQVFSEAEGRNLSVFRGLLRTVNQMERAKDPHDTQTLKYITAGKEEAFEIYRSEFYPDPRLKHAANDIIQVEKTHS